MVLRMGDGPVANLPDGLDGYAGYVNDSGIGETYKEVVARFPTARHLSITTDGSPAMCADVEAGAMGSWKGYDYGYAAASEIGDLILRDGRPRRLWSAHHTGIAHICTSQTCWPSSPVAWIADGTQWVDHGGWDESLLADNFFLDAAPPNPAPPIPQPLEDDMFIIISAVNPADNVTFDATFDGTHKCYIHRPATLNAYRAAGVKTVTVDWVDYQNIPDAS